MFKFAFQAGWVEVKLCWKVAVSFFFNQMGHCLIIAARSIRQASCPFMLSFAVLSVSI